ncbi:hypothetical protein [Parasediminibacterium sp. JCM 36343]|uniref:hypothetical protein n=1 Tax=Parasediminibacterium sp. JCM 36343 TaxID=3374279 RepID=UPI003978AD0B
MRKNKLLFALLLIVVCVASCTKATTDAISVAPSAVSQHSNNKTTFSVSTTPASFISTQYNDTFYGSVLEAAKGIAEPFLLQQGYFTLSGLTVSGTNLIYGGVTYNTSQYYQNPTTGYYVPLSSYSTYGISNFSAVWPTQCPNAFLDSTNTFNAYIDCVGYGTRLLSAVGNTTATGNAYLNLLNKIRTANTSVFAAKGYVATAYSFATAFPTITTTTPGWLYISGNVVNTDTITAYNKTLRSTVGTYNGVRKGGFASSHAGDILAFGYGPSSSSNGHFMVMEDTPNLLDSAGLKVYYPSVSGTKIKSTLASYKMYAVPVFDDSGLGAHVNDSRTATSGIGHGTLLIATSLTDDAPLGYVFDITGSPTSITIKLMTIANSVYAISVGRYSN